MTPSGRWSIARRTTRWFAISIASVVLAISAVGALFVDAALDRELEALVTEELDEVSARFPPTSGTRADLEAIFDALALHHPDNPMAWRVWAPGAEAPWFEWGDPGLLSAEHPARSPQRDMVELPGNRRSASATIGDRYVAGLVIDGSVQWSHLSRYAYASLALALIAGGIAFLVGRTFIHRGCRLLHEVAESARLGHAAGHGILRGDHGLPDEIREVAEALQDMRRTARNEADRTRLLTTGLAHELGSPLQNLIGETEVALMSERDSEQYRAVLRSHLEELRDIGYAIGNLMTLCAIDATDKGAAAELERFDLGREAELRLRRERTHAERRGVQLAIEPHGDLEIEGDREALLLAVSNLVANAIDWSPPGGRVVCDISGVDGEVDVTVDDAGPGVPDDERQHIFEPFQRGRAAKGRRAGYGLGLAIAKRAVDAHGGGVSVERSPLGGARFRLSLPRKRAA